MNDFRQGKGIRPSLGRTVSCIGRYDGFTLAEVLVVCAVASILAAAAAPGFGELMRENRLNAQMTDFANAHRIARSESVSRGSMVSICKSTNATSATPSCGGKHSSWADGWMVFVNADADTPAALDAGETVLGVSDGLRAGDTLRGSTAVDAYVTYQPTGEIEAAGTIVLCEGDDISRSRALFLSITGRVRITRQGSDGTPIDSCSP